MVIHLVVNMLCFVLRLAIFALAMVFNSGLRLCLRLCLLWFLNLIQTIQSDSINRKPFAIMVLLTLKTVLGEKSKEPFKP